MEILVGKVTTAHEALECFARELVVHKTRLGQVYSWGERGRRKGVYYVKDRVSIGYGY